jgi:hypothetical protein
MAVYRWVSLQSFVSTGPDLEYTVRSVHHGRTERCPVWSRQTRYHPDRGRGRRLRGWPTSVPASYHEIVFDQPRPSCYYREPCCPDGWPSASASSPCHAWSTHQSLELSLVQPCHLERLYGGVSRLIQRFEAQYVVNRNDPHTIFLLRVRVDPQPPAHHTHPPSPLMRLSGSD